MKKIAISSGDPAGIGAEIISKAFKFYPIKNDLIYIIYGKIESEFKNLLYIKSPEEAKDPNKIYLIKIDDDVEIGKISRKAGKIAYKILSRIADDLNLKKIDAVVTTAVCKESIQLSHPNFIGHTEFFAKNSFSENVVMSFWGPFFNLALMTTHVSLCDLSDILTEEYLEKKLRLIHSEIIKYNKNAKIAVLGINPHAGENGAFGRDDLRLEKVLDKLSEENIIFYGPFPADTFFAGKLSKYDWVISAYHDQGLIPFKMISFEQGVNVTLGLPYVRTSVDHGTAFDIAGKNIASEKSLIAAIKQAEFMLNGRKDIPRNYHKFAAYYDEYMSNVNYDEWINFILGKIAFFGQNNPNKILELGCGTANIATKLVELKYDVDASDKSCDMLKIADKKAYKPNLFQADMLDKLPTKKYSTILLLFDGINYLKNTDELVVLFQNTFQGLEEEGIFCFDISTESNCIENFDGFVNLEEDENSFFIHTSEYLADSNTEETQLTIFEKKGFLFQRFDEIHREKIFSVEEILNAIKTTDFEVLGIYNLADNENFLESERNDLEDFNNRLFFFLRRK
jgi:4-hydroxythreonine-4-phosphate dehydrogenase